MSLLSCSEITTAFLDSHGELTPVTLAQMESHFEDRLRQLQGELDTLLSESECFSDHQHFESALARMFSRIGVEEDALDAVQDYRSDRGL